jgi:hypothetical protein
MGAGVAAGPHCPGSKARPLKALPSRLGETASLGDAPGIPGGSGRGLSAPVGSSGSARTIATPVGSLREAYQRLAPPFGVPVGVPSSAFRLRPVPLEFRRLRLSARPAILVSGSRPAARRLRTDSRETPLRGLTPKSTFRPAVVRSRSSAVSAFRGAFARGAPVPPDGFGKVGSALALASASRFFPSLAPPSPRSRHPDGFGFLGSGGPGPRFVSEGPRPGTSGSCHALPSRPSGFRLWITGISGISWIRWGTGAVTGLPRPPRTVWRGSRAAGRGA